MYVDISNKPCLIVGGGLIAYRKAVVLKDFQAEITVVAENFCEELVMYAKEYQTSIHLMTKSYEPMDCEGSCLVVAATNHAQLNHEIAVYCKTHGIPVNAVDQKEDCTFIFPSYVRQKDLVAAFSSAGKSPLLTQVLKEKESGILTPIYGELNECLGQLREYVKAHYETESEQKRIYRSIYEWTMEQGKVPDETQIQELLKQL
jgi:uroporphyrin-III C-methyltransferase/precorrin-2 dehydrogenase/sirohydrochlorin ferrochelatase/precorrin-2 dehydrogenase/sirohydrochlorin ferrochelatase